MAPTSTLSSVRLYHFTDRSNVASIRKHGGLLSTAQLEAKRVSFRAAGNDLSLDLDRQYGMNRFVHLSLVEKHPLLYLAAKDGRMADVVVLRISRSVLQIPGVKYCEGVANAKNAQPVPINEAASMIDLEALYGFIDYKVPELKERRKKAERSEILIPDIVPLALIENLPNG